MGICCGCCCCAFVVVTAVVVLAADITAAGAAALLASLLLLLLSSLRKRSLPRTPSQTCPKSRLPVLRDQVCVRLVPVSWLARGLLLLLLLLSLLDEETGRGRSRAARASGSRKRTGGAAEARSFMEPSQKRLRFWRAATEGFLKGAILFFYFFLCDVGKEGEKRQNLAAPLLKCAKRKEVNRVNAIKRRTVARKKENCNARKWGRMRQKERGTSRVDDDKKD